MIKYCKSCSKEYSGDFCESCGYGKEDLEIKAYDKYRVKKPERFMTDEEKQERNEQLRKKEEADRLAQKERSAKSRQAQQSRSQWGFIVMVVIAFAAVVVFALYQSGYIFNKDKTEVIRTYFDSIVQNDFEGYLSTMVEPMAESYRKEAADMGLSDKDAMRELYSDYTEGFGEGYTITLDIGTQTAMTAEDIKASQKTLQEAYGESYTIKEAYMVAVSADFKGSKKEETAEMYVYIGKIKNDWYILNIDS